jgi:hypothetical protein
LKSVIDAAKLELGCCVCGFKRSAAALEYHHVDPSTKTFGLSRAWSKAACDLPAEASKCVILCANCHAEQTRDRLHDEAIATAPRPTLIINFGKKLA